MYGNDYSEMKLSQEQQRRIEDCIEFRFYSSLRFSMITDWLRNFDDSEIDMAISILEHIDYYRTEDISSIMMNGLDKLLATKKKLHFVAVGQPGKSGGHILYYVKNLFKYSPYNKYTNSNFYWNLSDIDCSKLTQYDELIFVDDIIGSGNTHYEEIINAGFPKKRNFSIGLLAVIINEKGKSFLKRKFPELEIYGESKIDVFDDEQRLFGTRIRTKVIREFAYKYGRKLDVKNPLGYKNSQMLVIFAHAVPNNTLPIIWKDTKDWKALVPRSHFIKNERAFNNRQDNTRWLVGLKNLFKVNPDNPKTLFGTEEYALLYVLRGLYKGKLLSVIANEMSIPLHELDKIFLDGVTRGLWDKYANLSIIAKSELDQVMKKMNYCNSDSIISDYKERHEIYVPPTFRELT